MNRLSVVVLNYNGWRDTVACVESLKKLDRRPDEVVVVDNRSTDDSEARLREACPGVTVLQSGANLGFAGGNNVGIRAALASGAEAVWLLNNDATAHHQALGALEAALERDRGVGAVGSRIFHADRPEVLQCYGGGWAHPLTGRSSEFKAPVPVARLDYLTGCSLFVRREAFERVGLLDEGFFMYFEDAEFGFRLRRSGYRLAIADDSVIWHKGGATRKPGALESAWRTQSLLRFQRACAPSYPAAAMVSTSLRALAMARRREWTQLGRLARDASRYAREPDWRRQAP